MQKSVLVKFFWLSLPGFLERKKSVWAEIYQKNCVLRSAIEELWASMPSMQVNKINILLQFISIETKKLGVWNTFINCNQEGADP